VNFDEIDLVLAHIEDNPERHDQSMYFHIPAEWWEPYDVSSTYSPIGLQLRPGWECETTACLAGHAAFLNGYRPMGLGLTVVHEDGRHGEVYKVAAGLLALDPADARNLFLYCTDLDDIRSYVEARRDGFGPEEAFQVRRAEDREAAR
jgi:hypothetical protein